MGFLLLENRREINQRRGASWRCSDSAVQSARFISSMSCVAPAVDCQKTNKMVLLLEMTFLQSAS